jgi:SAM-dependent methyltransferase
VKEYVRKLNERFRRKRRSDDDGLDWTIDWNRQHPNSNPEDLIEFWHVDQLRNITPPSSMNPAGFDEVAFLKRLRHLLNASSIVEIGCGNGRLASAFPGDTYLGLDINQEAIRQARIHNPGYRFELTDFCSSYPKADLYIAYTVFLHIDDRNMMNLSRRLADACEQLLIVEIMYPSFRNLPSVVPNFARSRADYERIFAVFEMDFEIRRPYDHYPGKDISYLMLSNRTRINNSKQGLR